MWRLTMLDCGLRISEALNRQRGVEADNLPPTVLGKGSKERRVPYSPELRKRIYSFEQLKAKKGIRSEYVFAGFEGTPVEGAE